MTFQEVISHLAARGYACRTSWNGNLLLVFGFNDLPWLLAEGGTVRHTWHPNLNDILATDWERAPYRWLYGVDDWYPFKDKRRSNDLHE